jgi:biotin transporter BioY
MCDNERVDSRLTSRNLAGTRDAVLVHGLALLAAAISITLAVLLRPNDQAFAPAFGVALTATGVLLVWALTLAARAWRRGERSGWAWAVMVLGSLEMLLLGIVCFVIRSDAPLWRTTLEWAWQTGWAVFLPVGVLSYLVAAPVTWWRLRRAAKRDATAGIK